RPFRLSLIQTAAMNLCRRAYGSYTAQFASFRCAIAEFDFHLVLRERSGGSVWVLCLWLFSSRPLLFLPLAIRLLLYETDIKLNMAITPGSMPSTLISKIAGREHVGISSPITNEARSLSTMALADWDNEAGSQPGKPNI